MNTVKIIRLAGPKSTRHLLSYVAYVDAADGELDRWHWRVHLKSSTPYAYRQVCSNGKLRNIFMHREIMGKTTFDVDHVSGEGLDNRRCNLRLATRQQNVWNQRCKNPLGVKGVVKQWRKYCAKIMINYKWQYLGLYETKEEAARAYDEAAKRLFGRFARLNYPNA